MHRTSLKLKGCPRCGGDILIDRVLEDGEVCIQCGFRNYSSADRTIDIDSLFKTEELQVSGKTRRRRARVK